MIEAIIIKYDELKMALDQAHQSPAAKTKQAELDQFIRESLSTFDEHLTRLLKCRLSPFKQVNGKEILMLKAEFMKVYDDNMALAAQKQADQTINLTEYDQIKLILAIIKDYYLPYLSDLPIYKLASNNNFRTKTTTSDFGRLSRILIVAVVLFLFINLQHAIIKLPHTTKGVDLTNIAEPSQSYASGGTVIKVGNTEIAITYVAEYSIIGRVVGTATFYGVGTNLRNKFSPRDVGIAWGPLSDKVVDKSIKWVTMNRFTFYTSTSIDASYYFSNNHLIPADKQVRKLMKAIKKNDYIRLDGYLVDVDYIQAGQMISLPTSIVRDDDGNGACEQIYVTKITWLKP